MEILWHRCERWWMNGSTCPFGETEPDPDHEDPKIIHKPKRKADEQQSSNAQQPDLQLLDSFVPTPRPIPALAPGPAQVPVPLRPAAITTAAPHPGNVPTPYSPAAPTWNPIAAYLAETLTLSNPGVNPSQLAKQASRPLTDVSNRLATENKTMGLKGIQPAQVYGAWWQNGGFTGPGNEAENMSSALAELGLAAAYKRRRINHPAPPQKALPAPGPGWQPAPGREYVPDPEKEGVLASVSEVLMMVALIAAATSLIMGPPSGPPAGGGYLMQHIIDPNQPSPVLLPDATTFYPSLTPDPTPAKSANPSAMGPKTFTAVAFKSGGRGGNKKRGRLSKRERANPQKRRRLKNSGSRR